MSTTTPIYGFRRPSSDDQAWSLGDDMGAAIDTLEAVLAGLGIMPSPSTSAFTAEVTARTNGDANLAAQLAALAPGAWQTPTITGAGAVVAGYQPARYRKLPALDSLQLAMVLSGPITAGQVLVTLPVLTSATTLGQVDVQSGGAVKCQSAVASAAFLGFAAMVPLS
jgi:hypothetical protein